MKKEYLNALTVGKMLRFPDVDNNGKKYAQGRKQKNADVDKAEADICLNCPFPKCRPNCTYFIQKRNEIKEIYKTSDEALAKHLKAQGFKPRSHNHSTYTFLRTQELMSVVAEYYIRRIDTEC